ncbi:MAG TPA: hypothetical protein VNP37_11610 [Actinomycetospora sp.]|nr:hypothetical protein [Actinomycetospora sp.]
MARSTLAAALLLAGLALGATACDTSPAVPPPAPVSVPPVPGAPAEQDDDGEGAQPPDGQGGEDDGQDGGEDDDG